MGITSDRIQNELHIIHLQNKNKNKRFICVANQLIANFWFNFQIAKRIVIFSRWKIHDKKRRKQNRTFSS